MLFGRGGFESPRALEVVDGEPGEAWSNLCAEDCGVAVSMSTGLLVAGALSPDGDGVGLPGEGGASEVGDRGGPPPHCDMNERTRQERQSGCCTCKARATQGSLVSELRAAAGAGFWLWYRFHRTYHENEA